MRQPEIINRQVVAFTGPFDGSEVGRLGDPLVMEIPEGVTALVSFFAGFNAGSTAFFPDSSTGLINCQNITVEAELTDPGGSSPRPLQLTDAKTGMVLFLGTRQASARLIVPGGVKLGFYLKVSGGNGLMQVYSAPITFCMWARALLVDQATTPKELAQLAAGQGD